MNKFVSFVRHNSSTILSVIASIGVVAVGVLSAKSTYDSMKKIKKLPDNASKADKIKAAIPAYVPPMVVGIGTIVCIAGANVTNRKQIASLTSACTLLNESFREYRDKLKELHGREADDEVVSKIASEKFPEGNVSRDKTLFYDAFSKRYFESTMEDVYAAIYNLNKYLTFYGVATINKFYEFLHIEPMDGGDVLGWSAWGLCENGLVPWLNAEPMETFTCEGKEFYTLDFDIGPIKEYYEEE